MKGFLLFAVGLFSAFAAIPARAKEVETDRVRLETIVKPVEAKRGQTVVWRLVAKIKEGCYSYPTEQTNPEADQSVVKFRAPSFGPFVFVAKWSIPKITM